MNHQIFCLQINPEIQNPIASSLHRFFSSKLGRHEIFYKTISQFRNIYRGLKFNAEEPTNLAPKLRNFVSANASEGTKLENTRHSNNSATKCQTVKNFPAMSECTEGTLHPPVKYNRGQALVTPRVKSRKVDKSTF